MIIAVFNQAGGVGKTTLTRDLGFELAQRGLRILLIDSDPQGTLGLFYGESPAARSSEDLFWKVVCSVSASDDTPPPIVKTRFGVDLGLANRTLTEDELTLHRQQDQARLVGYMDALRERYDLILVDCSPKISEIVLQVLIAVDALLVPVQTEAKAVAAFAEVQHEIARTQARRRNMRFPPIKVLGVVPTLFSPRLVLHRHHLQELTSDICASFQYAALTPIRDYVAVSEAGTQGMPLKAYAPECQANQDVAAVADEVMRFCGLKAIREVANG